MTTMMTTTRTATSMTTIMMMTTMVTLVLWDYERLGGTTCGLTTAVVRLVAVAALCVLFDLRCT